MRYNPIKLAILLLFFTHASALMVKLSLEELTTESNSIIIGKVDDIKCAWDEEHRFIYTYVTIKVEETLKGSLKDRIVVRHLGGEVDGKGLGVSDQPSFKMGERVLLFLTGEREKGVYEVYGWFQGKYTIVDDTVIEIEEPLSKFLEEIEKILKLKER
jgi:hypothetical protein